MIRSLAALALVLALPLSAAAAMEFLTGFETGRYPEGSNGLYVFDEDSATTCTVSTSPTPASDLSSNGYVLNCTSSGTATEVPILRHYQSSVVGCFAQVERVSSSAFKIKVYYEDDGGECQAGLNDGTECSADTDCIAETVGEEGCKPSEYAATGNLSLNTWYEVTVGQDNSDGDGGDVTCRLWVGEAGGANVADVCSQTRPQGECTSTYGTGGFAWACGSNADCNTACGLTDSDPGCCPSGCTCDTSVVTNTTKVRVGTDSRFVGVGSTHLASSVDRGVHALVRVAAIGDGASTNWSIAYDDLGVSDDDGDSIKTFAVADLYPDGMSSTAWNQESGCAGGSHHQCVDDNAANGALDDGSTRTSSSTAATAEKDVFTLSNIGSVGSQFVTDGAGAVLGVSATAVTKDRGAGTQTLQDITVGVTAGSTDINDTASTIDETSYTPTVVATGSSTDLDSRSEVDGATAYLQADTGGCSSNCRIDATSMIVEAALAKTTPTAATVLQDVNSDGQVRLSVVGDSTANDLDTFLCGAFTQVDSLMAYTQGSTTIGDFEDQWDDVLAGTTGGRLAGTAIRGSAGKPDYIVLIGGANTISNGGRAWPVMDRDYPTGRCRGGANHGLGCRCLKHSGWVTGSGQNFYCLNHTNDAGANWLGDLLVDGLDENTCRACSTNADCGTNISCTTNADCSTGNTCVSNECFIPCSAGKCAQTGFPAYTGVKPRFWWDLGCADRPECPDGLCIGQISMATALQAIDNMYDQVDVRTAGDAVEVIQVVQPRGVEGSGQFFAYGNNQHRLESLEHQMLLRAKARGYHWIDLNRYFQTHCINHDERQCYRDEIHWSRFLGDETGATFPHWDAADVGTDHAITALKNCLENVLGTSDGICDTGSTNKCTQGALGDACSTNGDCDTYSCAF